MKEENSVKRIRCGNYRIEVYRDTCCDCPADDWDGESKFYVWTGGYASSLTSYTGRYIYDSVKNKSYSEMLEYLCEEYDIDCSGMDDGEMEGALSNTSGIAIRFGAISGREVYHSIVLTDNEVRQVCWGPDAGWDKAWAERHIDASIETFQRWVDGEVYGRIIYENRPDALRCDGSQFYVDKGGWQEVDSCWGYYMDPDELIEDTKSEWNIK